MLSVILQGFAEETQAKIGQLQEDVKARYHARIA